jgi:hypothetical protein
MRYVTTAGLLVLTITLMGRAQPPGEDKGKGASWAKVTLGGEMRDLIDLRAKLNLLAVLDRDVPMASLAWPGPPLSVLPAPGKGDKKQIAHIRSMQVGDAAWVAVLLDPTDPNLDKELPLLKAPEKAGLRVIFEGRIAAPKDKEPFVAHANGTGTLRTIGQPLPKLVLGSGEVVVQGNLLPGKPADAKGLNVLLTIENGFSPILVTSKTVAKARGAEKTATVRGVLQIQKQGPLVVEAASITTP